MSDIRRIDVLNPFSALQSEPIAIVTLCMLVSASIRTDPIAEEWAISKIRAEFELLYPAVKKYDIAIHWYALADDILKLKVTFLQ